MHKEGLVGQVAQLVSALSQTANNIAAVGIAIPGLVNRQTDRVLASRDLPGIVRDDLHAELMKATGLRFELENDANAAAYGEFKIGAVAAAAPFLHNHRQESVGDHAGRKTLDGRFGLAGEVVQYDHTDGADSSWQHRCGNCGLVAHMGGWQ